MSTEKRIIDLTEVNTATGDMVLVVENSSATNKITVDNLMKDVPTKISDLENDSNFLTGNDSIDADKLNGKTFSDPMTQEAYDNRPEKDSDTIYIITDAPIRLTSPNGTVYKLSVSDDGTLSAVAE